MKRLLLAGTALCLLGQVMVGCGYHLRRVGRPVGVSIRSIAIPLVKAPSTTLGFEADFTRAVREEFLVQSRLPLVSRDRADAVFQARVREIKVKPQSSHLTETEVAGRSSTYETTRSRWLEIVLDARVIDRGTGEILWREKRMKERAAFVVESDPLLTRYNRREALRSIARSLAGKIYSRTMERF
ncbi:MAG: hypothetical protein JRF59_15465 [Deltaproteobacteria bacterium]|nr:hypothetical protein [Deltaproteobacteria bacterium]MBW1925221.1 hypothetical protein [Deltaproteobacteria bacterium]MBW1948980.1 hypothetical protein [Deltaproteobacteria bacterium]MBW2008614.1 hypothetical protein [Deltaproteobacteria bacterium]MBW2103028.1 hypothetical protein [Deltaproteobacteria bacterium]